mgnify:CR=1 FL=1
MREPTLGNSRSGMEKDYTLSREQFVGLIASLTAGLLISLPVLTHFSNVVLFPLAGIDINVRFLLMCFAVVLPGLGLIVATRFRVPRIARYLAALIVLGTVASYLKLPGVKWAVPPFLRLLADLLTFVFAYNLALRGAWSYDKFLRWVSIAACVPVAAGLFELAFGFAELMNGALRLSGTFGGRTAGYSLFMLTMGVLTLGRSEFTFSQKVLWSLIVFVLLATYSRQMIAAFAIALLGATWLQGRLRSVLPGIVFVGLLIPLLAPDMISTIWGRFKHATTIDWGVIKRASENVTRYHWSEAGLDSSILVRLQTTVVGWQIFSENPIIGAGFGSFVPTFEAITGRPDVAPHNDYLLYLVETGILGFFLYLKVQYSVIKNLILDKVKDEKVFCFSVGVGLAFIAFYVLAFLNNPYYYFEVHIWIWTGVGIAYAEIGKIRKK